MASLLYAAKAASATTSNLYTLDPATAASSSIGATGHAFTSFAFDPTDGQMYGTTSDQSTANPDSLYTIDETTGTAVLVGAMGGTVSDIAIDSTGQMWGWTRRTSNGGLGGANAALLQIDKSDASFAVIGSSGLNMQGGGISFHSNGTLYALIATGGTGHLYTVNTTTGNITDLGGLTPSLGIPAAASFDSTDKLYLLLGGAGGPTSLKWVDVGTSALTTIGNPGNDFDALAYSEIGGGGGGSGPYPTSASVVGVSVAFDADLLDISPTWTRIDADAVVTGWSVDRGRASEVEKTGTGTATVSIVDSAGDFDPTNSSSPFFGKLDPMKQAAIALYNPVSLTWTTIFRGFVAEWLTEIDATEEFFNVTLELVDALDVFARLQMQPGVNGIGSGPSGSENDVFFEGEPDTAKHVNGRINDALDNVSWPDGLRDIFSGNVTVRPKTYDRSDSILSVIQDAADAEFPDAANFYISKDGIATFHGRYARFYPTVPSYGITTWPVGDQTACAGDTTVVPVAPISMRRSENDLINSVLTMPNGLTDIFDPADFVVEDAVSIGKYGYRSENFEDLLVYQGHDDVGDDTSSLAETLLYSNYFIDNYSTPKTRVPELVFRPRPVGTQNASAWWGFVCGLDISDRVHLATSHPGGGGFSEYFFVEGVHYDADVQGGGAFTNVTLTVDVSPASFYSTSPFGTVDGSIPTGHLRGATMSVSVTGSTA